MYIKVNHKFIFSFSGNYTCNTLRRFQCNNHKCIPLYQKCDGIDNCGDGSDENNMTICSHRPRPCIFTEFRCANEKCIAADKICNHADDCGDSSDELGCRKWIFFLDFNEAFMCVCINIIELCINRISMLLRKCCASF